MSSTLNGEGFFLILGDTMYSRPVGIWIEDFLIILSLLTLWPKILGWRGAIFPLLQYLALGALVWILVRRIKRFRRTKAQL